jgi:hypothetical protein
MGDVARWFWRAIEHEAGWICHRGPVELDRHPSLAEAVEHLRAIAIEHGRGQVFAHYLDGRVETVGVYE